MKSPPAWTSRSRPPSPSLPGDRAAAAAASPRAVARLCSRRLRHSSPRASPSLSPPVPCALALRSLRSAFVVAGWSGSLGPPSVAFPAPRLRRTARRRRSTRRCTRSRTSWCGSIATPSVCRPHPMTSPSTLPPSSASIDASRKMEARRHNIIGCYR